MTLKAEEVVIYIRSAIAGPGAVEKLANCKSYCLAKWGGHGAVFDDSGISGHEPNRPAFALLLSRAAAKSVKAVVVPDEHTLGRELGLALRTIGQLEEAGAKLHVASKGGPVSK